MSIWLTDKQNGQGSSPNVNIRRTRTFKMMLVAHGVKPTSEYMFIVNNIDMTWTTKQLGQKMGDALMSNALGNVIFDFYGELNSSTMITSQQAQKNYQFAITGKDGVIYAISSISQTLNARV